MTVTDGASRNACQGCGELFEAARSDATYCSAACRQRAYRTRAATTAPTTTATRTTAPTPTGETTVTMTKAERAELSGIVKRNHRVAKAGVTERKAELMAEFEETMARQWKVDDKAWAAAVALASEAVDEANRTIAAHFEELGLPQEVAPRMGAGWASRGENMSATRRAELRRVAQSRSEAQAQRAKLELDRSEAALLTRLAVGALTSEEARAFLGEVPTIAKLMPSIDVEELAPALEATERTERDDQLARYRSWELGR